MQVLRLCRKERGSARVRDDGRRDTRKAHPGDPRSAHHRGHAARLAVGALPGDRQDCARPTAGGGYQGVHSGGDRFLPQEVQDAGGGGSPPAPVGRPAHDAGRRGRSLLRARPEAPLQSEDRCEDVARHSQDSPPSGNTDEQHPPLRPHRDSGRTAHTHDPPARGAGRNGRLPHVHPSRLPAG